MRRFKGLISLCSAILFCFSGFAFEYYPGGVYDEGVPPPKAILGYEIGEDLTEHMQMEQYIHELARTSKRVKLFKYGSSYEGRNMYLMAISSPANLERLDEIRSQIARLRDPRKIKESEAQQIARAYPAIVWLNYGNDGNEAAAFEAAMQVAYQLAAGLDQTTREILDKLVVLVNPCANPESHQRYVVWYRATQVGRQGTADPNAVEQRRNWRMDTNNNHYQIDLNRDAFAMTQQETQMTAAELHRWNPQIFVDFHSGPENYAFPPYALPINRNLPESTAEWARRIGQAIASDFSKRGWSFFTGEVYDIFYPGYWDSYPALNGAIGMTYEVEGGSSRLRSERRDGTIITLRDGIHRHFVASMATLKTAMVDKEKLIAAYFSFRKSGMEEAAKGAVKQYVIPPQKDMAKAADFVELLLKNGIEVYRANAKFTSTKARSYFDQNAKAREFAAGSFVVPAVQPQARLLKALMEQSPDQNREFIEEERLKRERNRRLGPGARKEPPGFYDVTAWTLPLVYGVEAYYTEDAADAPKELLAGRPLVESGVKGDKARYAYVFAYESDGAAKLLARLMSEDFRCALATKPFASSGVDFPKGTVVVRVERNPESLHERIAELARKFQVAVYAVNSAWTDRGPALGSSSVLELKKPKVAVVTEEPTSATSFGAIWFMLEREIDMPFTALAIDALRSADLSKYNVIVLPDGSPDGYKNQLGANGIARLKQWIESGGVLVAIKGAAAFAAAKGVELASAKLLAPDQPEGEKPEAKGEKKEKTIAAVATPGAILRVKLNTDYYLGYGGYPQEIATLKFTRPRFGQRAQEPVDLVFAPTRMGANVAVYPDSDLRLAGFIWDEAEKNLAETAYLVDDPLGRGHVILFADDPNFRVYWKGLTKLFLNSMLLAPSF